MNNRTKQKIEIFIFIIFYTYYLSVNQPVRFHMLKNLTKDSTLSLDVICDRIIDTRPRTVGDVFKILCSDDESVMTRMNTLARWAAIFQ